MEPYLELGQTFSRLRETISRVISRALSPVNLPFRDVPEYPVKLDPLIGGVEGREAR